MNDNTCVPEIRNGLRGGTVDIYPSSSKCDFCDVTFNCDLDAERHLRSTVHVRSRDTFVSLQNPQDKIVEKNVPENLGQVFGTIKLRTVRDLVELADKGYFDIVDETGYEIAGEMARVLFKSVVEFETKDLPPEVSKILLDAIKKDEESPVEMETTDANQTEANEVHAHSASTATRQNALRDRVAARQSQVAAHPCGSDRPTPAPSPSISSKPATSKQPTPNLRTLPPVVDGPSTSKLVGAHRNKRPARRPLAPDVQPRPKAARTSLVDKRARQKSSAPTTPAAKAPVQRSQPSSLTAPVSGRGANTQLTPLRQSPAPVNLFAAPTHQPFAKTLQPSVRMGQPNVSVGERPQPIRGPQHSQRPQANSAIRPTGGLNLRNLLQHPSASVGLPGRPHSQPDNPRESEVGRAAPRQPVPNPNSDYIPQLATIKVEPKD